MLKNTNNFEVKTNPQLDRIENIMRSLMNKNSVVYSNHSKTADTLSDGICTLQINSADKSFVFTFGRNRVVISPLDNSIKNLLLINDISVDDILTGSNIMNNQYLKDMFDAISEIIDLYDKYITISEPTNTVYIDNLHVDTINNINPDNLALKDHTHTTFDNNITINGGLAVNGYISVSAANYFSIINAFYNNISKGQVVMIRFGKNNNNYNTGEIKFYYNDEKSTNNCVNIGVMGGTGLRIYGNNNAELNGNLTVNTINNINTNDISLITHNHDDKYAALNHIHDQYLQAIDIDDIKHNITGITYTKNLITPVNEEEETINEEEEYEIYTTINQDLNVNGNIQCNNLNVNDNIVSNNVNVNNILYCNERLYFDNNTKIISYTDQTSSKIEIVFPNGNCILMEDTGYTTAISDDNTKRETYLTKQMIIDDEDIQEILMGPPGEDGKSSYKRGIVEAIWDNIANFFAVADAAYTIYQIVQQIKTQGWAGYLYQAFGYITRKANGYEYLPPMALSTRSVIFDDSVYNDNNNNNNIIKTRSVIFDDPIYDIGGWVKPDCEVPDWEDIDESFNEFNYVASLFPSMNNMFKSIKEYYREVEKGQRTNELGMLLIDAQIYNRFINHTHSEYLQSIDIEDIKNNITGITYTKNLIINEEETINEEEEEEYEIYTTINQDLVVNGNIQCNTINNINTNDISLNTHNHDDRYALIDHNHDSIYSNINHIHSYNDLTDKPTSFPPADHTHTTFNNNITIN